LVKSHSKTPDEPVTNILNNEHTQHHMH